MCATTDRGLDSRLRGNDEGEGAAGQRRRWRRRPRDWCGGTRGLSLRAGGRAEGGIPPARGDAGPLEGVSTTENTEITTGNLPEVADPYDFTLTTTRFLKGEGTIQGAVFMAMTGGGRDAGYGITVGRGMHGREMTVSLREAISGLERTQMGNLRCNIG